MISDAEILKLSDEVTANGGQFGHWKDRAFAIADLAERKVRKANEGTIHDTRWGDIAALNIGTKTLDAALRVFAPQIRIQELEDKIISSECFYKKKIDMATAISELAESRERKLGVDDASAIAIKNETFELAMRELRGYE